MRTTSRVVSGCLALLATLVTNCLRQVYGRTLTIMLTSKYCISFNIKSGFVHIHVSFIQASDDFLCTE